VPGDANARAAELRALFPGRFVLLAASTREGEEALLLEALSAIAVPELLLLIVPRHPQRFDTVAALIARQGCAPVRRSAGQPVPAPCPVMLGDSMGEMPVYYAACDIAFVGGSLLPLGGQNLIEAAAAGKPVLVGPHTWNFRQAADLAIAAGAALRVEDAASLVTEVNRLYAQPEQRERMGLAGLAFARAHRGATARVLAMLEDGLTVAARR